MKKTDVNVVSPYVANSSQTQVPTSTPNFPAGHSPETTSIVFNDDLFGKEIHHPIPDAERLRVSGRKAFNRTKLSK